MVPRDVVVLERFPLTPTGKIDRRALPEPTSQASHGGLADRPMDDLEQRLALVWKTVMRVPEVGLDDTFFELGGHSLLGLNLLLAVEKEFGKRLPVNSLLTAASVRQMAVLIRDDRPHQAPKLLVPIQPNGTRPPVYWLPGGGGLSVMAFRNVSYLLGNDQPVFGLEADLDLERAPRDLKGLARSYIDAIREYQPRGPYYLLGFSLGCFVAYEIAVQLREMGEEIALLVAFDTEVNTDVSPQDKVRINVQRTQYRAQRLFTSAPGDMVRYAKFVAGQLRARIGAKAAPKKEEPPTVFETIIARNVDAIHAYAAQRLPTFDGKITAVLAEDTSMHGVHPDIDPRLNWRHTCTGGMEVFRVPGNHLSMLDAPHVETLAATLRECIVRVQAAAAVGAPMSRRSSQIKLDASSERKSVPPPSSRLLAMPRTDGAPS
jgi:thioesterase domain-containing protein/acyl carrier protein